MRSFSGNRFGKKNTSRKDCTTHTHQAALFNGHKWKHGLQYQGINSPSGLILNCFGPRPGRNNDVKLLRDSGVLNVFHLLTYGGQVYRLFGDAIYPLMNNLYRPFINPVAGSVQAQFNTIMSRSRTSVEWSFGTALVTHAQLHVPALAA